MQDLTWHIGRAQYGAVVWAAKSAARVRHTEVTVDGVRVPMWVRDGEGTPVVLVHGFGADKEGWLILAGMLDKKRPLVIPDLPGFGAAGAIPKERATAKRQAEALLGVLDHLAHDRAHFVGSSMGGGISLRVATDAAHRTASLTLIGSVGPLVEPSELTRALDEGKNLLITETADDLDRLVAFVTERPPPGTRAMRRYLGTERVGRRQALDDLFDGWYGSPEEDGVPTDLESIDAPALVVHGLEDRVVHVATARALAARLKNARRHLMSGVGHLPHLEAPRETAAKIERFLAQLP